MLKTAKQKSALTPTTPVDAAKKIGNKPELKKRQTKQSRIVAMLQTPAGTTIAAMMKASGWQQHSVRGFLAGVVRKRLKLKLASSEIDGTRVYRIGGGSNGIKPKPPRAKPSAH